VLQLDEIKHSRGLTVPKEPVSWKRLGLDSLSAIAGVTLATVVITLTHLYPRIPTIPLVYLLVVLLVASGRGLYAAILASLLAFLAYLYFLVPPLYSFLVLSAQDLLTLVVFLTTAVITGQLASLLRRRAEQAQASEREIRILYEQAQELAALQERQRLARELHDSVSQALYAISLGAHTAREALANEPEEATASLEYVIGLAEAGLAEMRALIFELRPESLASEGLVAAISKQVAVMRTRYRLAVQAHFDDEPDVSLETKYALYRISQEALHNIIKHARATTVVLSLTRRDQTITLEVHDDGLGFDPTGHFPGHLGLQSMQARAKRAGGSLSIESHSGQGTLLVVRIPLLIGAA
jgi:signal transduction histidine kinase